MKNRRTFLKGVLTVLPLGLFSKLSLAAVSTPPETEGPFYPTLIQQDTDFDLTHIQGQSGVAKGRVIWIEGQVTDTHDQAISGALVDLWQANAAGRYRHHRDRNQAPLDPRFQGWAMVESGREGRFRFKTVYPGIYPASAEWRRPPHIHFKVSKRSYTPLTTQMYFPGEPLNDTDLLLMQKSTSEVERMIAQKTAAESETYFYNIVLQTSA